jgi:hypothetical protein
LPIFDNVFLALLLGATLIGTAAGLLVLLTGRIMSGSGMIGSLLGGAEGLAATSIAFIGGLVSAPMIMTGLGVSNEPVLEADWPFLLVGGLLIGFAARYGGASLFGAITGIAKRSGRAAIMFLTILAGAMISIYLQRLLGGGGVA